MAQPVTPSRSPRLTLLSSFAIIIAALYLAKDVLIPIALGVMLSFLLAPLVTRLQRWGLNRITAVAIIITLLCGAFGGLGMIVFGQIRDVADKLPEYQSNIEEKVTWVRRFTQNGSFDKAMKVIQETTAKATSQPSTIPTSQ